MSDNFDKLVEFVEEKLSAEEVDGYIDMGALLNLSSGFMDEVKARAAELGFDADEVAMQLGTAMEALAEEQEEGTLGKGTDYVTSAITALIAGQGEILEASE